MKEIASALLSLALAGLCCGAQSSKTPPAKGVSGADAGTKINWVRYDDPAENAFSLEVPQGWEAKGGAYRFGYFDVRAMMDVRSPDGKIIVRVDDASVPPYALPGPNKPREGTAYNRPQQYQMVVERYQTGQAFAELYAKARFRSVCLRSLPESIAWKPELPATSRDASAQNETEGSVAYTCDTSDGPRTASVYALTHLYSNGAFWTVEPLISILAAPDRTGTAEAVAQHMLDTFRKNPKWVAYQNQMTQAGLQMIQRNFQEFMAQVQAYHEARSKAMDQQVAGYESKMAAQQKQVTAFGETLTGLQNVVDPMTGQTFQVWSGPGANYYRNGLGDTVNGNTSPGSNYHQVQPKPPN